MKRKLTNSLKIRQKDLEKALEKGLRFIESRQEMSGAFSSLQGNEDFSKARTSHATFSTSLILSCLASITGRTSEREKVASIASKGTNLLLKERSPAWTWNYWERKSQQALETPYPDDLDDTCCALSAILLHKKETLSGETLASLAKILTSNEERVGGPYETWIVDHKDANARKPWRDIDLGVNANVAYFLSLHDISLPNLEEFIEECIREKRFTSLYYFSPYPIIYFISRWYKGSLSEELRKYILEKRYKNGSWGDDLSTSLAATALLNLGEPAKSVEKAIDHLIDICLKRKWRPLPLYIEENKTETLYAGSAALTAAFCIEAIAKFQDKQNEKSTKNLTPKDSTSIKERILTKAAERFETFPTIIKQPLLELTKKIASRSIGDEIVLLPYHFRESLSSGLAKKISDRECIQLGLANLMGWMAYTIYDDLLDDEGDLALLPCANICLREVIGTYKDRLTNEKGHAYTLFTSIMDGIEHANAWERKSCRFETLEKLPVGLQAELPDYKNYGILADKSLGHALGPIALLESLGYAPSSEPMQQTLSFFRHYLIARQLNDDAHDWLADLERGFVNSVSSQIVRDTRSREKMKLQETFWNKTVLKILDDMSSHIASAKTAIRKVDDRKNGEKIFKDVSYFDSLLAPIEQAVEKTISERTKMKEFLDSY